MESQPITLCDQSSTPEPATHSYVWEWGASGTCCASQVPILQQTANNLGRSITFGVINSEATPPLQRDERVKLKAEAFVLAEELAEAKGRGLDMYRHNTQLTAQVQSLTLRNREAEAQKKDAIAAREEMDRRLQALEAENASLNDELGRLRVLVDASATHPGIE
jgi:chromosome segregation ATPase